MIFSDRDIKKLIRDKKLIFRPKLSPAQIGPASIDLRLSQNFKIFQADRCLSLDPKKGLPQGFMKEIILKRSQPYILHPKDFVLASTQEYICMPDDLVARVEGKSTLARMGILVHTAGFIDPGFEGTITLEISNHSGLPVLLYPGMYICQVAVEKISSRAQNPYNKRKKSLYNKQTRPTAANTKNLF